MLYFLLYTVYFAAMDYASNIEFSDDLRPTIGYGPGGDTCRCGCPKSMAVGSIVQILSSLPVEDQQDVLETVSKYLSLGGEKHGSYEDEDIELETPPPEEEDIVGSASEPTPASTKHVSFSDQPIDATEPVQQPLDIGEPSPLDEDGDDVFELDAEDIIGSGPEHEQRRHRVEKGIFSIENPVDLQPETSSELNLTLDENMSDQEQVFDLGELLTLLE